MKNCWGCIPSSDCYGCWDSDSPDCQLNKLEDDMEKLIVKDGVQDVKECQVSIKNLGTAIGNSDLTSTLITRARISSMRTLLNLLEDYNNQLINLRKE